MFQTPTQIADSILKPARHVEILSGPFGSNLPRGLDLETREGRAAAKRLCEAFREAGVTLPVTPNYDARKLNAFDAYLRAFRTGIEVWQNPEQAAQSPIAFSHGPQDDAYQAGRAPSQKDARRFHNRAFALLQDAGIKEALQTQDPLHLFEAQRFESEIRAILESAAEHGQESEVLIGMLLHNNGQTYEGRPFHEFLKEIHETHPDACIGINCTSFGGTEAALEGVQRNYPELLKRGGLGPVYPNASSACKTTLIDGCKVTQDANLLDQSAIIANWAGPFKISILGGCCGYTPEDVKALATAVRQTVNPDRSLDFHRRDF